MITIDGSKGEGGGQVLRSSLSLSMVTGQPFRMTKIRGGRAKPGLMRQHLTCVRAAEAISEATVDGAAVGSGDLTFRPGTVVPGEYAFAVGTAGSTTLVLQTILPPLMLAPEPSVVTIEGGTHNDLAPPFDFLELAFLPLLRRMGAKVQLKLDRLGFQPVGGGCITAYIPGRAKLDALHLTERGPLEKRTAISICANINKKVAQLELDAIAGTPGWADTVQMPRIDGDTPGRGNALLIVLDHENLTEVFIELGALRLRSHEVAARAIKQANTYLKSSGAVGEYLADQLLLPMALGQGGCFTTAVPSRHTRTNAEVIGYFLDRRIAEKKVAPNLWEIEVK